MLVNIYHDTRREHLRLAILGVVFLTVLALLVALSVAIYAKVFDDATTVTVKADRAGLQLAQFGDVRRNGVLVGYVDAVEQDGEEASITIQLDPEQAERIPADVEVRILPTTLFGQKFVSLVDAEGSTPPADLDDLTDPIQDGDVIPSDRVETNVELSRVLADTFPLIRALRPAELSMALNALSTALDGRGEQLGETLDELDLYLRELEPTLPALRDDLDLLAEVADAYDQAAPDLLTTLDNLSVTARTVVDERRELGDFFTDLTRLADDSAVLLSDNEADLLRVGSLSRPVMAVLARYAPQLTCTVQGAAVYERRYRKLFEGSLVKQYIELGTAQYRVYDERDAPEFGEVGGSPECYGLPFRDPDFVPPPLDNGSDIDSEPPTSVLPVTPITPAGYAQTGSTSGYAGSDADGAVLNAMLADETGRDAATYGDTASLLYGAVVRGGGAA